MKNNTIKIILPVIALVILLTGSYYYISNQVELLDAKLMITVDELIQNDTTTIDVEYIFSKAEITEEQRNKAITNANIDIIISDDNILKIENNTITALSGGSTNILLVVDDVEIDSKSISITPIATDFNLNWDTNQVMDIVLDDENTPTYTLETTTLPDNNSYAKYIYTSNDTDVAIVSDSGMISFLADGTTSIIVEMKDNLSNTISRKEIDIEVAPTPEELEDVVVTPVATPTPSTNTGSVADGTISADGSQIYVGWLGGWVTNTGGTSINTGVSVGGEQVGH